MKILVFSDVHGMASRAEEIIARHSDIKDVFFLGDGIKEIEEISENIVGRVFHMVLGNCDRNSCQYPLTKVETINGKRVMFTHGHDYSVKLSLAGLKARAAREGARLVLFGHTHRPHSEYEDGIYYVNPGALGGSPACYAVIDLVEGGIMPNLLTI